MASTVKTSDVPGSLLNETGRRICAYAVGFVKAPDAEQATLGGSGTLVRINDLYCILTAAHVAENLLRHELRFGVILPRIDTPQPHKMLIERDHVLQRSLPRPSAAPDDQPPDLAVIVISNTDAAILGASHSFYDLTSQVPANAAPHEMGFWALTGFAEEWTNFVRFGKTVGDHAMVCRGKIMWCFAKPRYKNDPLADCWAVDFDRGPDFDGPASLQGYSGGGLWQILLTDEDGPLKIKEMTLSGVAFYQTGLVRGCNTIYCNGRSIIRRLVEEMSS